jgi:histidinol-phosphate aminotransferase
VLNKIKPPYNINKSTQELALTALDHLEDVNSMIRETVAEREVLVKKLSALPIVDKVYPSDANFVLVKVEEANKVYDYLKRQGIIVRNRSTVILCDDCIRITVGTPEQDEQLIAALATYK